MSNRFRTTRWSVVLDAGDADDARARDALATLCQIYWPPLYAFARRRGAEPANAEDLVQGFFAALLEKDAFARVDPERGRFRGFLVTSFKRYCASEYAKATAQKRGGGRSPVRLDRQTAESQYALEPVDESLTPERLFERRWALTLLARVFDELRDEWGRMNKASRFEQLSVFLGGHSPTPTHAEVADALGLTTGSVKVAVHRLRKRYRALLRDAVAETVSTEDAVDDEIRRLVDALRS